MQIPGFICRFVLGFCKNIKKRTETLYQSFSPFMEVPPGFGPGNEGFADLCLTTWLWHQINGAVDETRTRDLHLGKVALYQLSYYRIDCGAGDGNRTHVASLEGWNSTIELHPRNGAVDEIRTRDIHLGKVALYH